MSLIQLPKCPFNVAREVLEPIANFIAAAILPLIFN